MSMNPGQENFAELRRLLALKRHEQPPPGYFNSFSAQVIARIQAGEHQAQESALQRLVNETPWLRRIWALLDSKPVLVGAAGVTFCGLMLAVVLASEHVDTSPVPLIPAAATEQASHPVAAPAADDRVAPGPLFATENIDLSNPSAAATTQSRSSLFQDFERTREQWVGSGSPSSPVNFTAPPGN
jgi:hypothetical protein